MATRPARQVAFYALSFMGIALDSHPRPSTSDKIDEHCVHPQEACMARLSVRARMARSIALRKGEVLLRSDFDALGSASQISRALKQLIEAGTIVRLGYGLYAKARPSVLSGRPIARVCLAQLAQEAFEKLGVPIELGRAQAAYAAGETTQIPVHTTFNTGRRRITRKITVGKSSVRYENNYLSRA